MAAVNELRSEDLILPRLCHIKRWGDHDGYGFTISRPKDRPGEFITNVDANGPAAAGGVMSGWRVVAVNQQRVIDLSHQEIIAIIRQRTTDVEMLLMEEATFAWAQQRGLGSEQDLADLRLEHFATPNSRPVMFQLSPPTPAEHGEAVKTAQPVAAMASVPPVRVCRLRKGECESFGFSIKPFQGQPFHKVGVSDLSPAANAGVVADWILLAINGRGVLQLELKEITQLVKATENNTIELGIAAWETVEWALNNEVSLAPPWSDALQVLMLEATGFVEPEMHAESVGDSMASQQRWSVGAPAADVTSADSPPVPVAAAMLASVTVAAASAQSMPPPYPASLPPLRVCRLTKSGQQSFGFSLRATSGQSLHGLSVQDATPAAAGGVESGWLLLGINQSSALGLDLAGIKNLMANSSDCIELTIASAETIGWCEQNGVALTLPLAASLPVERHEGSVSEQRLSVAAATPALSATSSYPASLPPVRVCRLRKVGEQSFGFSLRTTSSPSLHSVNVKDGTPAAVGGVEADWLLLGINGRNAVGLDLAAIKGLMASASERIELTIASAETVDWCEQNGVALTLPLAASLPVQYRDGSVTEQRLSVATAAPSAGSSRLSVQSVGQPADRPVSSRSSYVEPVVPSIPVQEMRARLKRGSLDKSVKKQLSLTYEQRQQIASNL